MGRYLKLGGLALAILVAGFLLGSGSIGDIIRTWVAGTGASADQAEVDETAQEFANRDAENMGQALGAENARLSYSSALRCEVLAGIMDDGHGQGFTSLTDDQLDTIAGNARAIVHNRIEQEGKSFGEMTAERGQMAYAHRTYHDILARQHDREMRVLATELETACSSLLGRPATQQSTE